MFDGIWYCGLCVHTLKSKGYLRFPDRDHHIFRKSGTRSKPEQKIREAAISREIIACATSYPHQYDPAYPYPAPPTRPMTPQCLIEAGFHSRDCAHQDKQPQKHRFTRISGQQQHEMTSSHQPTFQAQEHIDPSFPIVTEPSVNAAQPWHNVIPFREGETQLQNIRQSECNQSHEQPSTEGYQWQHQHQQMDVDLSQQSTSSHKEDFNPFADAVSSVEDAAIRYHRLQRRHYELQVEHRALEEGYENVREMLYQQQFPAHVVDRPTTNDPCSQHDFNHAETFIISGAERRLIEVVRRLEDPPVAQGISVWECMSYSDEE